MSALCQKQTHALQQKGLLFDQLVGARRHGPGNGEAERFTGKEGLQTNSLTRRGLWDPTACCFIRSVAAKNGRTFSTSEHAILRAPMNQSIICAIGAMICYGFTDFIYKQGANAGIRAEHFLMV